MAVTSSGEDRGDIVVTARRREETSQDVPIALSVVGGQTLDRTGNATLVQIQQLVPTLQVTQTNPRNTNITIRGLGSSAAVSTGDGLEYGVGFYVDGVYYGRPGQSQFDLIDLAQIEVLRGPQGTLFGKNTTAGALNITTREPSFDPELIAEGWLGNYDYHQFRATGSLPIVDDKVAVRLSVSDTKRDGFLTNLYDGRDAQDYDSQSVRGQLLIKPSDNIRIRIIGDYSKQKQRTILFVDDGYFTRYANGALIPNNILDRAARFGYTVPAESAFRRTGNANSPFSAKSEGYGVSGQVDWDLGAVTLTSVTAYRGWDWRPQSDTDATPLSIQTKGFVANDQRQFSQELRVASNGTHTIDYVAGLFYYWQIVRGAGQNEFGADFARWNLPASTPPATLRAVEAGISGLWLRNFSDPETRSYAAFGQLDWHISSGLTLTSGLRFTHEDKNGSYSRSLDPASGGNRALLTAAQQAQFQVNDLAFSAKLKDDALSGLVTLSYKVSPTALLYGSYSRGSKSGGLNLTSGGATRPVSDPSKIGTVDPEKVDAFEIGLKSQFLNKRLTLNAAAFLTQVKDYQANVSEQPPGFSNFIQYIANIPKVRSKGIEADFSFAPNRWVNLTASAAYTDARYVSFTNAPQAPEATNQGPVQDLSGTRLPGVSKFAYSLSADLTRPLTDNLEVYGRADWLHRSSFNSTATNSIYGVVPAYGVLNARFGVRINDGRIDVAFWARNLLDKDYYVSKAPGTFGQLTAITADPRTIGGTVRVNW